MPAKNIQPSVFLLLFVMLPATETQGFAQAYYPPSYAHPAYQNYGSGFGGGVNRSSFNGGFSGLAGQAQMPAQPPYRQSAPHPANKASVSDLEQKLNAADTSAAWAQTPVSGAPAAQTARQYRLPLPPTAVSARQAGSRQGMFPGISRQQMLRVFLEGGSPNPDGAGTAAGAPSTNSSANASNAYSNYQRATSENTRARNYANTARYDQSQWNRKDAASQAEYAASNAEYAAQRAESAAYSGDSQARSYANLAREAANSARYFANQARYNADTIR